MLQQFRERPFEPPRAGRAALWCSLPVFLAAAGALAHSPICYCFDNEDGGVTCEGGFSDGASAEGVAIRVLDDRDRVLLEGKMDDKSEFSFERPAAGFHVVFDAGDEHVVTIFEDEIE